MNQLPDQGDSYDLASPMQVAPGRASCGSAGTRAALGACLCVTAILTHTRVCGCAALEGPGKKVLCRPLVRVMTAGGIPTASCTIGRFCTAVGLIGVLWSP